jgi:4-amino-4-deoxy-L-arabinose transferase-like glycosyltransferase
LRHSAHHGDAAIFAWGGFGVLRHREGSRTHAFDGGGIALPHRASGLDLIRSAPLGLELVLLACLVALEGVIFSRGLDAAAVFDEGVYLASLDALQHGQHLGSQVFASQPPGFYALLQAERAILGPSIEAMRVGMLLLGLVACLSAYYIGRAFAGRIGGFVASGFVASIASVGDEVVRVRADFPAAALALLAIALILAAVRHSGPAGWAAAAMGGAALAAAVSVKLVSATAIVPVLVIVLRRGHARQFRALAAGAAAVAAALLALYAGVLGPLWSDVVRFHFSAQSAHIHGAPTSLSGNFAKLLAVLGNFPSPFPWLVIVGASGTLLAWRRRELLESWPLWLWPAITAAFLVWHRPLWGHDVAPLRIGLAVASGVGLAVLLREHRKFWPAISATSVAVIAGMIAYQSGRAPAAESGGIEWGAAVLRSHTHEGSEVAGDLPIIPFYADRRQPGNLIDSSWTRIGTGWLTPSQFLSTVKRDRVSAVVLGHNFARDQTLERAVRQRYPRVLTRNGVEIPGEGRVVLRIYLPGGR